MTGCIVTIMGVNSVEKNMISDIIIKKEKVLERTFGITLCDSCVKTAGWINLYLNL